MVIFDCNGVLVDSESIVAEVAAQELNRVGIPLTPELVSRYFAGRRPADMFAEIEKAYGTPLPTNFATVVNAMTMQRLRAEVRATRHVDYALTWLRGPKCVASSTTIDRIRVSLDVTGLLRFFEPHVFSASEVARGKPAPDLFLYAAAKMGFAPAECIVVEDSPAGIAAAHAAGMQPVGFVGGTHAAPNRDSQLIRAGARVVLTDMRQLKATVTALRGW